MQKNELRSTIKNLSPKYAKGSEYHNEVLDRAIEKVINQLYTQTFLLDPLSIQRYVKRFGTVTPITVSLDGNAGIYYSNYPTGVMPISLPDKASGVRRVTTKAQAGVKFYPMDQREQELLNGSVFANYVNDKVGYVVTQDRIEYYGMPASIAADGVRMDCLVAFSDYGETDQILVPEMPDPQGATFTDMVLKILGVIRPQDTLDNNLDTAVNTKE